jgi:two-component system response regulator YesN
MPANPSSNSGNSYQPLQEALEHILDWIKLGRVSHIMVAADSPREMKRQELPDHIELTIKKRTGKRISKRGSRHYKQTRLHLAHWPDDCQMEKALPTLIVVISGQVDLHIADYVLLHCRAGDFIYFPAGISKTDCSRPHFEDGNFNRSGDILWLYPGRVQGEGIECWICHSHQNTHEEKAACWVENAFLSRIFQELGTELENKEKGDLISYLLSSVLFLLYREIRNGRVFFPWYNQPRQEIQRGQNAIDQACIYIDANLSKSLTISKVARFVGMSPASLTRRFREQTGLSFNQYCTQQRLKGTESLLVETDLRVIDICKMVGLQYSQLRTLFKSKYGCSPMEYRHKKFD